MNTKSALIIAVAIVIGFSIEPILDRVDFSDPEEKLVKFDGKRGFFVAGGYKWVVRNSSIVVEKYLEKSKETFYYYPADKESARIGLQLVKD